MGAAAHAWTKFKAPMLGVPGGGARLRRRGALVHFLSMSPSPFSLTPAAFVCLSIYLLACSRRGSKRGVAARSWFFLL